jgi:hypothetical protein
VLPVFTIHSSTPPDETPTSGRDDAPQRQLVPRRLAPGILRFPRSAALAESADRLRERPAGVDELCGHPVLQLQ